MEIEEQNNNSENKETEKEKKLHTRQCHYCKQPINTKIGIDNWKNLFRRPTLDDWVVLIILMLLLLAAFAYTTDTKACRETIQNLDMICLQRMNNIANTTWNGAPSVNSNVTFHNNTSLIVGNETWESDGNATSLNNSE
jgi:hypothetical protein